MDLNPDADPTFLANPSAYFGWKTVEELRQFKALREIKGRR